MSSFGDSIQKLRDKLGSLGKKGGGDSGGGSKAAKFDAKKAVAWMRRNPAIIASVLVMVAAPTAAWWFSSQISASAAEQAKKRADEMAALERLEKTSVDIARPGLAPLQQNGVVTNKFVAAYQELNRRLHDDAMAVQKAALSRNTAGRHALDVDIKITANNASTIMPTVLAELHESLVRALKQANAGVPPLDDVVGDQVQRRLQQFISGERKESRSQLNAEEQKKLAQALTDKRLQVYTDAAASISFYADPDSLDMNISDKELDKPSEVAMFFWQWRVWMAQDVISALADANKSYRSVLEAPVKQLSGIIFSDKGTAEKLSNRTAEAGAPPAEAPPANAGGGAEPPATVLPPIDPKAAVPYDFTRTFTGRISNPLYEVRRIRVDLVVATSAIPEVLNAIARQNFMTVTNMSVLPADPFAAAVDGYIYGPEPVSRVILDIESIWMLEWMGKLMPRELQEAKRTNGRTIDDLATGANAPSNG